MKVLVVRPMELPAVQEIDHTLSGMQELVGGTIQAVYPFDDPVALVCNDEGKLLGLPWNRTLTDDHGVPYDIVCGTFFVAGLKEDDFASLTEQQIEKRHLFQRITMPITLVLVAAYIFIMSEVGFTISTFIFLTLQITLLSTDFSAKSWLKSLLIALVASVSIYLIFATCE